MSFLGAKLFYSERRIQERGVVKFHVFVDRIFKGRKQWALFEIFNIMSRQSSFFYIHKYEILPPPLPCINSPLRMYSYAHLPQHEKTNMLWPSRSYQSMTILHCKSQISQAWKGNRKYFFKVSLIVDQVYSTVQYTVAAYFCMWLISLFVCSNFVLISFYGILLNESVILHTQVGSWQLSFIHAHRLFQH